MSTRTESDSLLIPLSWIANALAKSVWNASRSRLECALILTPYGSGLAVAMFHKQRPSYYVPHAVAAQAMLDSSSVLHLAVS